MKTRHRRSLVDPREYVKVVGRTFIQHEHRPLLVIGTHSWSRWSLGRLGCPHPIAAMALNRVVQELRITSIAGLAAKMELLGGYEGLGVTAYWTVLAILREAGYAIDEVHPEPVTFATLKQRARKAQKAAEPRLRKRRAGPPSDSDTHAIH